MSLFDALGASAGALQAYQEVLAVTQQNLLNASTPGYAKQRITLQPLPYDPSAGAAGVTAVLVGDTRNGYAEHEVWRQISRHSEAKQYIHSLSSLEPLFAGGDSGLAGAIRSFFSAAAAWSSHPNDRSAREALIGHAHGLAASFRGAGEQLQWALSQIDHDIAATVGQINGTLAQLRDSDAASAQDANVYAALENLAADIGVTAYTDADGKFTVALAGQTTLLTGSSVMELRTTGGGRIEGADGADLTSRIGTGRLKALLEARTEVLDWIGDSASPGQLNSLAATLAGKVNELLGKGLVSPGPPAQAGGDLFRWDKDHPNAALSSMSVSPGATAATLAAYDPGPPPDPAGIATQIAQLDGLSAVDGQTFEKFYESVSARTASRLRAARAAEAGFAAAVETAVKYRSDLSGVSVEEEAVTLLAVQRAYEASARALSVIDELLVTTISLID